MRLLRWASCLFFLVAAAALGYYAYVTGSAWMFRRHATLELSRPLRPGVVLRDGLIGRIEIPRLRVSVALAEGADDSTLRKAAGHIEGTALPGEPGNVGIAGHRDTFFRPLRHIRPNDLIVLDTLRGSYRYRVVSTGIVKPRDVGVLSPTPRQALTMVTCYPFYYIGSAPYRFIVRAKRVAG